MTIDLPDHDAGSTFVVAVVAYDELPSDEAPDGVPSDVTGWRFRLTLRRPGRCRPTRTAEWTAPGDTDGEREDLGPDAEAGRTWAVLSAALTERLRGGYTYEVEAAPPDGGFSGLQRGRVRFRC